MRTKYITTQIRLACLSRPPKPGKDIHVLLQETIAEHQALVKKLESFFKDVNRGRVVMVNGKAA